MKKLPLSRQALRARDRFFTALRSISLRDLNTARSARRIEHEIHEALYQIERYVHAHRHSTSRTPRDCLRIATRWLELAAESAELDADLADILTLLARHWLLLQVGPRDASGWVQRAEVLVRMLSLRTEHRGQRDLRDVQAYEGHQPMVTLVLRGLPRGAQPVEVEMDLGDAAVIGRADTCDWVLPGEVVSRQHARLRYDREKHAFFVANLSRNGLGLDDDRVLLEGEAELTVGTVLRIPKEGHYLVLVQSVFVPVSNLSLVGMQLSADSAVDLAADQAGEGGDVGDPGDASDAGAGLPRDTSEAVGVSADVIDMGAVMQRDSSGIVLRLLEQYPFLTPAAAEHIRRYVYGQGDAEEVVRRVFADVLTEAT